MKKSFLYENEGDGLTKVHERYHYWTEKLTNSSFELSLSVIAANWAIFGSVQGILTDSWAKYSMAVVLIGLILNLIGTKLMSEWLCKQVNWAEANPESWSNQYKKSLGTSDPWPFTKEIDTLGWYLRQVKTWLPIISVVLLIIGLFLSGASESGTGTQSHNPTRSQRQASPDLDAIPVLGHRSSEYSTRP